MTNRLYRKFLKSIKYQEPDYWKDKRFNGDEQPVVGVSWNDVNAYCDWLSRSNRDGHTFRLPSVAEWEWAAGRGVRIYPWGEEEPTTKLANFDGNVGQTTPVGSYPAGATPDGLMDMAGNVFEWCEDWWDEKEKTYRVLHGGSWGSYAGWLPCADRLRSNPVRRNVNVGFRVVHVPSH